MMLYKGVVCIDPFFGRKSRTGVACGVAGSVPKQEKKREAECMLGSEVAGKPEACRNGQYACYQAAQGVGEQGQVAAFTK